MGRRTHQHASDSRDLPVRPDLQLRIASMMASTAFFFLRLSSFHEKYRAALCFTGLVTFIAMYHYFRIFNSFDKAYTPCYRSSEGEINYNICDADKYKYQPTGIAFNDACRHDCCASWIHSLRHHFEVRSRIP